MHTPRWTACSTPLPVGQLTMRLSIIVGGAERLLPLTIDDFAAVSPLPLARRARGPTVDRLQLSALALPEHHDNDNNNHDKAETAADKHSALSFPVD